MGLAFQLAYIVQINNLNSFLSKTVLDVANRIQLLLIGKHVPHCLEAVAVGYELDCSLLLLGQHQGE